MRKVTTYFLAGVASMAMISACENAEPKPQTENVDYQYVGPTFETTLEAAKTKLVAQMALDPVIPTPKDAGGGYTHEKHKDNAKLIYDAAALYQLTGDASYADYAIKLMTAYADVYPEWSLHPQQKEQSPGRMFWQNLNESWWLVHVSQGYEVVKDRMTESQRSHVEQNLLRNMANFLSVEAPETFDKIHNHGTWATAAVGLTGYAIGDQDYVEKALLGLDKSGEAGFLKQMDVLFSPDGYYNEGPYYQRYALMPFVVFGHAVNKNNPEKKIFEVRDGILKKAIYATIQQNYNGLFFPINDAIKDKGISTTELLYGVSIAYDLTGDPGLLSVAKAQGKFVLTPESRAVSDALKAGDAKPFAYQSMRFSDGASGDAGALDILRASEDPKGLAVVAKNTSQGLGHGHFDKLNILVYDQGHEILRDYGAARFLNVEAKYGGHYLPENNAYAKQTVAHNTLVVDEVSHFGGVTEEGNKHAPELGEFVVTDKLKATTASINTAYKGVNLSRTVAMIEDPAFAEPVIIDVMRGKSDAPHSYDLPFHYNGHLVETNFDVNANPAFRAPLGDGHGYQYLWNVAETEPVNDLSQITWILDRRFYTVSTHTPKNTDIVFFETGANDPNFNLRHEPGFMFRTEFMPSVTYASVIEPHGEYNPTIEYTLESHSRVASVTLTEAAESEYVRIETKNGDVVGLIMANDQDPSARHKTTIDGVVVEWTGPYHLLSSETQTGDAE